jgi:hypothetical protein
MGAKGPAKVRAIRALVDRSDKMGNLQALIKPSALKRVQK